MSGENWRLDHEQAARDLLGQQGERAARAHDWVPGDFVAALLQVMFRADAFNLALLGSVFPAHAHAVHVWKNWPDGYEALHRIAGWEIDG